LGHPCPVDKDQSAGDEIVRLAPGAESPGGEEFTDTNRFVVWEIGRHAKFTRLGFCARGKGVLYPVDGRDAKPRREVGRACCAKNWGRPRFLRAL